MTDQEQNSGTKPHGTADHRIQRAFLLCLVLEDLLSDLNPYVGGDEEDLPPIQRAHFMTNLVRSTLAEALRESAGVPSDPSDPTADTAFALAYMEGLFRGMRGD